LSESLIHDKNEDQSINLQ